jgi:hypothetical protein
MLHPNGYPAICFQPMSYEPDGKLLLSWSERELGDPPWELRLELISSVSERWGYLSLVRPSDGRPITLDVNVLSGEFRRSLSRAVKRACDQMEKAANEGQESYANQSFNTAASSKVG